MKGIIHKILNEKTVMKDVEIIIEMPTGSLKFIELRKGDLVQIVNCQKPKPKRKAKKKDGVKSGRL